MSIWRNGIGAIQQVPQPWTTSEYTLQQALQTTQRKLDAALKDDFDTPLCITLLLDLIKSTNLYMAQQESSNQPMVGLVLRNVATYITQMLQVFGLTNNGSTVSGDGPFGFDVDNHSF